MHIIIPGFLLAIALAGLGWWGQSSVAPDIEAEVSSRSAASLDEIDGRAQVATRVKGRDIYVEGAAGSEADRDVVVTALSAVPGARTVVDLVEILPNAAFAPSGTTGVKAGLSAGNGETVPGSGTSFAQKATIDPATGKSVLMSVDAGKDPGLAATPYAAEITGDILKTVPPKIGSGADPATPPSETSVTLSFDADEGAFVSGAVPTGISAEDLAEAFGLSDLSGSVTTGAKGSGAVLLAAAGNLRPWLPSFETASLRISNSSVAIQAETASDIDPEVVREALSVALPGAETLDVVQTARRYPEGYERDHAATGFRQSYSGGYWYPVVDFAPNSAICTRKVDDLVDRVNFVDGAAALSTTAPTVVSALTMTIVNCLFDDNLMVAVDPAGGLSKTLAEERAKALADALVNRGVPSNRIDIGERTDRSEKQTLLRWTQTQGGG